MLYCLISVSTICQSTRYSKAHITAWNISRSTCCSVPKTHCHYVVWVLQESNFWIIWMFSASASSIN